MHTAKELASADFVIQAAGKPASLKDIFPAFSDRDRLGAVVRGPCGATGASALILAAITAFYDVQRQRHGSDGFFIYPDYFLFHAGRRWGDHGMLDIWPSHKEVEVPDEPEELLRAINDRGVTRLLVEDRPAREPAFERESLASARDRIVTALAYAADGRVAAADVQVAGNDIPEGYVTAIFDGSAPEEPAELTAARERLRDDGRVVESYRRLSLEDALARL
jgi:hypothetical protein